MEVYKNSQSYIWLFGDDIILLEISLPFFGACITLHDYIRTLQLCSLYTRVVVLS